MIHGMQQLVRHTRVQEIVRSDDKKRARLNCISHLLSLIPYDKVPRENAKLPKRSNKGKYDDQSILEGRRFVPEKY
jgi:polyphosphate kinase